TYGAKWLAEEGHLRADAVLIGEPCGITKAWEAIDLVSRGAALFKIRVTGTQTHSSISDRLPTVNATVHAARLIDRMHRELKGALSYDPHPLCELGPTVNVGVMASAGVYYGVYPGEAEFGCDIRTIPGMTRKQLIADIQAFLERAMSDEPELHAELHFEDIYYEPTEISPDAPIAQAVKSAAATVLGASPPFEAFPGATDAAHIQGIVGIPTVAAFGPGYLPRAHSPNESVPVEDIGLAAKMFALAAWRFVSG
ncbi:MAG: M20 family metallopeptidase, partial [Gaiellaceae bacterium]